MVQGLPASDNEERLARAMSRFRVGYEFQWQVRLDHALPLDKKNIDFLVKNMWPLDVNGFVGHKMTTSQRVYDRMREVALNGLFQRMGKMPLMVIEDADDVLRNQAAADQWVQKNLARL